MHEVSYSALSRKISAAIVLCLAMLLVISHAASAQSTGNAPSEALCRFGVNHDHSGAGDLTAFDLGPLHAGFFIDYRADTATKPAGMEQLRMVRLEQPNKASTDYNSSPALATLVSLAQANPGEIWLIGNEPDRITYQDDLTPEAYARAYRELRQAIKGADPTAIVVAGNIVQASPLRLRYLDLVLAAHRSAYGHNMEVDAWGIHAFILNEQAGQWGADIPRGVSATAGWVLTTAQNADFSLFQQQVLAFRTWMQQNGYRSVPLYITEYGVLMPDGYGYGPFSPTEISDYMRRTFDFLLNTRDDNIGYPADDNHLVQHFSWYSINDKIKLVDGAFEGFNGYLFDPDLGNQRSPMGDAYANYTAQLATQTDLLVSAIRFEPAIPVVSGGPVTITIQVEIGNAGNSVTQKDFMLQLYHGDPAAGGQLLEGSQFSSAVAGCGNRQLYTYTWPNVEPDSYEIFAVVSPGAGVTDSQPANNQLRRSFFFATDLLYLPSVRRQ
jgi:hypothetical protein